jgi:hypothetical protein
MNDTQHPTHPTHPIQPTQPTQAPDQAAPLPAGRPLWRDKARASLLHAAAAALVVAAVAAVVLALWFPGVYRGLSGGLHLLLLVVVVDVVMGPVLTFVVFNPAKPRAELARDLGIIVALQLAALGYGVWTLAQARPTHLVFEVDLFRVVTPSDLSGVEMDAAPPAMQRTPWTGPVLIGVTKPTTPAEQMDATMRSLAGQPLAAMPRYWVPFESQRPQVLSHARGLTELRPGDGVARQQVDQALARAGLSADQARWLPLMARRAQGVVLVDSQGEPRALVDIVP